MSATVKLSSKLPGDPTVNGLDSWADHLLETPDELIVCIAYVDAGKALEDFDAGTRVPVARVRRIEPLGVIVDVPQAVRDAMATAEQTRTGRTPIPFEIVDAGEYAHADTLDGEE